MKKFVFALIATTLTFGCAHKDGCCGGAEETDAKTAAAAPAAPALDAEGLPTEKVNFNWNGPAKDGLTLLFDGQKVKYDFAKDLKKKELKDVKIQETPFRETLNQVVASAGYDYSVENGTVHVKNGTGKKATSKKAAKDAKK
jgi:hypothetical protein